MHTCLFLQESKDSLLHMQVVGYLVVFCLVGFLLLFWWVLFVLKKIEP